ncbi:MAG: EFR1 family ferrodoxin [Deltaproteobacteria bacterium]|nr:EFR1 family ferrodoxin [Deltaproteobacteria bacterium]
MKCIVIYYSQTGNTKKIAKAIHRGMLTVEKNCEIARLKDVDPGNLTGYDLIGIGSPLIHAREHLHVAAFVNFLKSVDGKHAFVFCTHGTIPGYYMGRMVPALRQRGLTVIGWNNWFAAAYHPVIPKPYFTDGHPDEIDLKEAEDFGKEMVARSKRISNGEAGLIPTLPTGTEYDERYFPVAESPVDFKKLVVRTEFKVNMEKCNYPKCHYCMDSCPMDAIDFSVIPPQFDKDCDFCWLCEQTCPMGAIEIDYRTLDEYHKPLNKSVLQKSIDVFEAKGLFRRLVPDEDIGWDTSFYKNKKPRFKIDY